MESLDWIIFGAYLIFVFVIGVWASRKASTGIESYFVANRSMPWWWLGISIIATTFAADTPLAVTGITAENGIVGNWLWWSWAATYITVAIFFAKRWRKSKVLTDVEFIELRYDGKAAAFLRGFKAGYFGIFINCFILGWVITAAVKIAGPFIDWSVIIPSVYAFIDTIYPTIFLFKGDLNATITIMLLLLIVLVYSSLGGIRGVILTDLFQFVIAIVTSIFFAIYAVKAVGGLGELQTQIHSIYGAEKARHLTEFLPSFDNPLMPIQIFLIYVVVQWWVRYDSDGTGYIAQRINTAASPKDAQKGSLLFSVAFIALRTWPWILVALVSLVLFPLADADMLYGVEGAIVGADREMAYPLLMKLVLPVGLLGLTFTSLMAAFMSTVDTHFNWGASYLSNDIYRRFINPKATEKQLVGFSRWMVAFIAVLAVIFASQMDSIGGAWKFFINAASGMGIAQLMRWLWWRANAWTEISAMITALITTFIVTIIAENMIAKYPYLENHYDTYALVFIALLSIIVAIVFTFLTPKVGEKTIKNFIETCQPVGIWKGEGLRQNALKGFGKSLIMWVLGMTVSFAGLFSIGYFLMLKPIIGILALVLCVGSFIVLIKMMEKE